MKFTNISGGPRGLNTKTGTVLVEAGQSIDVDLEAAEKKVALGSGWFVEGDAPKTKAESDGSLAALQALVAERDATITDLNKAITDRDEVIADLKTKLAKLEQPGSGPEAKHRGAGSYSIMDGDTELREKLSKEQADKFNALDADAKANWLADNPKPTA